LGHASLDRSAESVAKALGVSLDLVYQARTRVTRQLRERVQRIGDLEERGRAHSTSISIQGRQLVHHLI
jgi:hypothetical protein